MGTVAIIFSILSFFVPIIATGVVIYIIVMMTKNKDGNTKFRLSPKTLLQIYLFVISFLTLGIAVLGGVIAIKASTSYVLDLPFSYSLQKANDYNSEYENQPTYNGQYPVKEVSKTCYQGEEVTYYDSTFCFDSNERKSDLINGFTLFISMVILFAIHQYAISKIGEENMISWLKKIYIFASLILYSVVGLVAIPTAIYQLTNFMLFEVKEDMYRTPEAPALAIAIVLLVVPLWIIFLKETTKLKED